MTEEPEAPATLDDLPPLHVAKVEPERRPIQTKVVVGLLIVIGILVVGFILVLNSLSNAIAAQKAQAEKQGITVAAVNCFATKQSDFDKAISDLVRSGRGVTPDEARLHARGLNSLQDLNFDECKTAKP